VVSAPIRPIPRPTRILDSDRAVRAFLQYAATVVPYDRILSRAQVLAEAEARVAAEAPQPREDHPDDSSLYHALRRQGLCVRCKARSTRSLCPACIAFRRERKHPKRERKVK